MKVVCLSSSAFSLLSFAANAQASVGIGIKGGLNFANVNATQSAGTTYNNRTGYHFGAYTLIKLGKLVFSLKFFSLNRGQSIRILLLMLMLI